MNKNKVIGILIENYVAGGSDKIARNFIDRFNYKKLYLFVNKNNEKYVLSPSTLPDNVELIYYNITTLAELGNFANKMKKFKLFYLLVKIFNLIMRYPIGLFYIVYFYFIFKKTPMDIFISNNGGYPGGECNRMATIAASFIPNLENFHLVHNIATYPFFKLFVPIEKLIDKVIDKRSKIICVSQETVDALLEKRAISQNPILIYNGVEKKELKKNINTSKPLSFINVGALDDRKNQLFILDALSILKQKGFVEFEMFFIGQEGEKGYKDEMLNKIKEYDLINNVHFKGFDDPYKYYPHCDIFLLSSKVESFALVRVEAMSVGMPIITTNVGDASLQVSDNGFIVDNPDEMALALEKYFLNTNLIKEHSIKSHEIFEKNFTMEKMITSYEKVLEL